MRHQGTLVVLAAAAIVIGQVLSARAGQSDSRQLIVYDGADGDVVRAAIVAAIQLLPRRPARVAVIDVDDALAGLRPTLLRLDAFVTVGRPVVYVIRQSPLLQGAVAGGAAHRHALAAVIWHEMAHVGGADERQARRQEEALWMSFIRDQRIDAVAGLQYLKALVERPDDMVMAGR